MILSLKKTLALGLVVALLAGIAVYAYRLSLPQTGPRVTITSPPLEFSMQLDKTEYAVGENITIRFYLKNIGNGTITVLKGSEHFIDPYYSGVLLTEANGVNVRQGDVRFFHFGFSILDNNATEVFRWQRGLEASVYYIDFEPAGYVQQTLLWDPVKQIPIWNQLGDTHPLLNGTYQIRAMLDIWIAEEAVTLETPSITFTIK